MKTKLEIGDYHETVGVMRGFAAKANHSQPGNPEKLSAALIAIAAAENPPLRLALGSDTYVCLQAKNAFVESELQQWKTLTLSTDFCQGCGINRRSRESGRPVDRSTLARERQKQTEADWAE